MPMRCNGPAARLLAVTLLLAGCTGEPAQAPAQAPPRDGFVQAESNGLRVLAGFSSEEIWQDRFSSPQPPEIALTDTLRPDGVASLVLIYTGPAVARPGFGLTCRATVDSTEGRVFDGEPTRCSLEPGPGMDRADVVYPSPLALVLRGQAGQRAERLRVTVRVEEAASGSEIVLELPLEVAAGRG